MGERIKESKGSGTEAGLPRNLSSDVPELIGISTN